MRNWCIWLLLVLCNLFWAGNYVFGKYVIADVSPLWITFLRWALALFFLLPIALKKEQPDWATIRRDFGLLASMGVLGIIGFNMVLYSALAYTTATNAALVSALNPGVIVMVSVFLFKERVSALQAIGFITSLVGAFIVLVQGDMQRLITANYNQGDLLMLVAVTVWTIYSFIGKRLRTPPITATAVSTAIAVCIMAPFALYQGIDLTKVGRLAITGILYMVIFPSVCSFIFWNISVRAIGASRAGVFLNLIPVFAAIISVVLGENITLAQGIGGFLVFTGVYLTTGLLESNRATQRVNQ